MKTTLLLLTLTAFSAAPVSALAAAKGKATTMPDFTKGDTIAKDGPHDWTLGPIGARGWIYTANGHSAEARQILVTAVPKGSPADGALREGDVILGVGGKNFTGDARIQFARAIMTAEAENGGGALRLIRWRNGQSQNVELKLKVLGSYSATAPYNCPKSKRIFEQGCQALAKLDLLSRLHIREGMHLCVSVIELNRWGAGNRLPKCLECLGRYGTHAREVVPQLRQMRQDLVKSEREKEKSERVKLLDKSLAAIEASTASPTVLDLKEFMAHSSSDR